MAPLLLLLGLLCLRVQAQLSQSPTTLPSRQPTIMPTPINPPVTPTILPTTSAQLSPSTSVTGQSTTPTTTSLSTNSGIYSFDFSFRRLSEVSNAEAEFDYNDFTRFTRVSGAPSIDYVDVGIAPGGTNWVAIARGGQTYISADAGLSWYPCISVPGATKVIFNVLGEVIFLSLPLTYNGTVITNGVDIVQLDALLGACIPPAPTAPTPTPSPTCSGSCCHSCGVCKGSRITTSTSSSTVIFANSTSVTEATCLA